MVDVAKHQHWEVIAHRWNHVGSPLRPLPEDAGNFSKLLDLPNRESVNALILGVTPELFNLPWPAGSTVRALDRSSEMIQAIWPGPAGSAMHANWLDAPLPPASFDCILCDGGLHLLEGIHLQRALPEAVGAMLRRDGQFIVRLFAQPPEPEEPDGIFSDLRAGKIPNVHIFKLRVAMALQRSFEKGIVLSSVHEHIVEKLGSLEELSAATGWPRDEVFTLTSYQQSRNRYHFATERQSVEVLSSSGRLTLDRRVESHYPLGERCPLLSFRKT